MYTFTPPTYRVGPTGSTRLDRFFTIDKGISILKINGVYQEQLFPLSQDTKEAEVAYIGGHEYIISDAEADGLIRAGYGNYLTEIV